MKLSHSSLLIVVLVSSATLANAAVTVCPKQGSIMEGLKYHSDTQCDRAVYNQFKCGLNRHLAYQKYKDVGGISQVASQKTVKCPAQGAVVNMKEPHASQTGMDTVWFVENSASTPVVVSYRNEQGLEVSAKNPKISPAVGDPNAVLAPGRWMAVYAYEGHEFVVREVLKTGVAGNVLLQHRAGLIPVGTHADALECPEPDVEPMVNNTVAPQFARTKSQVHRPCNTMDVGFRNTAGCPLHGYYVSGEGESCREQFKFHLGVETVVPDFMWDWLSQTKYEGTFIGHTFHFRLASNPAVLVDTITLAPVVVTDCPLGNAVAAPVQQQMGEAVLTNVGLPEYSNNNNATGDDLFKAAADSYHNHNGTDAYYYSYTNSSSTTASAKHTATASM